MKWTTREIKYLEDHAEDGAEAIAEALGRSVQSVKAQAKRFGLSLRRAWQCPKCGMHVHTPLSPKTGWCQSCTLEHRNERIAEQVRELPRGGETGGEAETRAAKALQREAQGQKEAQKLVTLL